MRIGHQPLLVAAAISIGALAPLVGDAPPAAAGGVPLVDDIPGACTGPTSCVVDIDVPTPAGVVVPGDADRPGNRVRIILPPGYGTAGGHPLLLLLHGAGDGSESWVDKSDVEEFVAEMCIADESRCPVVVMPDGGGKHSETGWYTDWHDGSRQWESFHIAGVLPFARANLDVGGCRESTLIAGLSMGGFGSFSYAARHPGLFMAAASFSGFLDIRPAPPLSTVGFQLAEDNGLGAPTEEMFGPSAPLTEQDGWSEHNPTELARAGAYAPYDGNLWLATGTGTPGGAQGDEPDNVPTYAVEAFLFEINQNFRVAMAQAGTTFHDHSYVGGNHAWPYWQAALRAALPEMLDVVEPCTTSDTVDAPQVDDRVHAALGATQSPADTGRIPDTGARVPWLAATTALVAGLLVRRLTAPRAAHQRL